MKEEKLYVCYSIPLKRFLKDKGIRFEIEGKHKKTNCPFWVYFRTDELKNALDEWAVACK